MRGERAARRRVVVTGLGAVTPLGSDLEASWNAALKGRSGVRRLAELDAGRNAVRIGAPAAPEIPLGELPPRDARRLDRFVLLALAAAREAVADSRLEEGRIDKERAGVAVGSGIGGLHTLLENHRALLDHGPRRVSPFLVPMSIANAASGYVSIRHGLRGPNLCHVSACASGAHALGEALRAIERGDADVMLAGGSEAALDELVLAGFAAMRALSTRNEEPERASRPFDAERDGFVLGEGAALLVLEALEHARARGAHIRAELLGYGASADAHHLAAPDEEGEGAQRCMRAALADAEVEPGEVQYLNAHATGTPAGDAVEACAVRAVFGAHTDRLAVSSTKSMTGHMLGAAGAIEAGFCVRALESGMLPPTTNLEHPDPDCALDHVANECRRADVRLALSNSFGFGGTNAALVLQRWEGR